MQFVRNVKDGGHYDVIVCGAGPGGCAAAITAARLGKRVLLIDSAGCLGGYWTGGLMGISLDMPGKGGLPREIVDELTARRQAQWVDGASYTYDIESMKRLLERLAFDAGVQTLLYARVTDVRMEGRRIAAVLADGMTSQAFTADWFVDGTGHGTLASLAGCGYDIGHEESGRQQPASLEALVTGVPEALWQSDIHNREVKRRLKALLLEMGVDCTYPMPLLFRLAPQGRVFKLAINHQYDVDARDDFSVTRGTLEARAEIGRAVEALRRRPGWEQFTLVQTAEQLGLRDNRRVHGLYEVTARDALAGRQFEDAVSPVHFSIDVHKLAPDYVPPKEEQNLRFRPFSIPMRSLIPRDADNLFLTGRCISGDFLSHSAYRTTCTACALGEAVGVALASLGAGRAADTDGRAVHAQMLSRGYAFGNES